ncbi:MAG: sulfatase-like hydrolase/transferase [Caldilineaceae bacterium]
MPAPRMVIIFVLDDVGYGQMSAFGGLVNTPNLERLAAQGLREHPHHGPLLADPVLHPDRAQSPFQWRGRGDGDGHRLSRLQRAHAL